MGQVDDEAVEPVRDRRARRAPDLVLGPKHEVIDEELRASSKEIGKRGRAPISLESVLLVDSDPGKRLPLPCHLVALPRQRLLGLEQFQPRRAPFFLRSGRVISQRQALLPSSTYTPGDCACFPK